MAGKSRAGALRAALIGVLTLTAALAACGSPHNAHETAEGGGATPTHAAGPEGTVVVFAATSLTDSFNEIASEFRKKYPDVTVKFNYAGSSSLATQLTQGAPADVFASANQSNMTTVTDHGIAEGPKSFARNEGEIMVGHGNPRHIMSVADLANSDHRVVTCAPAVPCGALAEGIFHNAGVTVHPVSQEQNVGGVVTKVSHGEADAGIVYVTDIKAAQSNGNATGVPIPASENEITDYPITELKDAHNSTAAKAFTDFVLGPEGQHVLESHGFLPPAS